MNVMHYHHPWNLLNQLQRETEQLFKRYEDNDSSVATVSWAPAVDIKEEEQHFVIQADIPGVDPKDIEVSMEKGVLSLKGERKFEKEVEKDNYKRVERVYGTFHRRFTLPETADAEKISASGKNGVLEIVIPKQPVVQPRRIEVQS